MVAIAVLWKLWDSRNAQVVRNETHSTMDIIRNVTSDFTLAMDIIRNITSDFTLWVFRGVLSICTSDTAAGGTASPTKDPQSSSVGDNVAAMLDRLNLTSQESSALIIEEEDEDYPGCPSWAIVGKVLAPNTLHISTIGSVLRLAWGNPRGLEFHPLGPNRFMAEFGCKADKDRVLLGSPWMINTHYILFKEFDPILRPSDVRFDTLSLWAHIMNLPFGFMNDVRGKALASKMGKVEKTDVDDKGRAWGDFLCVRVSVDVNLPLMRCVSVLSQKRNTTDVYQGLVVVHLLISSMGQHGQHGVRANDYVGEGIPPPKPRKPRATRAKKVASTDVYIRRSDGSAGDVCAGKLATSSGQKRKEYQPIVPVDVQDTSPLPMILVGNKGSLTDIQTIISDEVIFKLE
ncbi:hypothetical protein D1007_38881 [Hordeum vulgare]|nr:hypothetical protein D1007_38881 [Hordeum vulgare]